MLASAIAFLAWFAGEICAADVSPEKELEAMLESIAHEKYSSDAKSMAQALLKIWHTPEADPSDSIPHPSLTADTCWRTLTNSPTSPALFAARDRAARHLLTQICGPVGDDSLPHVMRAEFEKAISLRDWDRCQKILDVDRLLSLSMERPLWTELLGQLKSAETKAADKDLRRALSGYNFILLISNNPTACELAIRRIKEIQAAHSAAPR